MPCWEMGYFLEEIYYFLYCPFFCSFSNKYNTDIEFYLQKFANCLIFFLDLSYIYLLKVKVC